MLPLASLNGRSGVDTPSRNLSADSSAEGRIRDIFPMAVYSRRSGSIVKEQDEKGDEDHRYRRHHHHNDPQHHHHNHYHQQQQHLKQQGNMRMSGQEMAEPSISSVQVARKSPVGPRRRGSYSKVQ